MGEGNILSDQYLFKVEYWDIDQQNGTDMRGWDCTLCSDNYPAGKWHDIPSVCQKQTWADPADEFPVTNWFAFLKLLLK